MLCCEDIGDEGDNGRCVWCTTNDRRNVVRAHSAGRQCPNRWCRYSHHVSIMVDRHQYYFCTYRDDACYLCRKTHLNTRRIDHLIENHCAELQAEVVGDVATSRISLPLKVTDVYRYVVRANKLVFYIYIDYTMCGVNREIRLISNTEMRSH